MQLGVEDGLGDPNEVDLDATHPYDDMEVGGGDNMSVVPTG